MSPDFDGLVSAANRCLDVYLNIWIQKIVAGVLKINLNWCRIGGAPPASYFNMAEFTASEAAAIGKALGDPTRLSIYSHIANRRQGLFCGELGDCHMFSMATISHHLRVLTQAGLIISRRSGQHIFYRAIPARLAAYRRYLVQIGKTGSKDKTFAPRRHGDTEGKDKKTNSKAKP